MRTIITLFFTFFSVALSAQEIQWMSLAEALEAQKKKTQKNLYGCLYQMVWTM